MEIEGMVHIIYWHALQVTKCVNISYLESFWTFTPDALNIWKSTSGVCVWTHGVVFLFLHLFHLLFMIIKCSVTTGIYFRAV